MSHDDFQPDDAEECQQPGDIEDHVSMLINAARNGPRASIGECQALLMFQIDIDQQRAYAEGRDDETAEFATLLPGPYYMDPPDGGSTPVMEQLRRMAQDAGRYRFLCEHPDWLFMERICRAFPAQSAGEFYRRLSAEIDRMRHAE